MGSRIMSRGCSHFRERPAMRPPGIGQMDQRIRAAKSGPETGMFVLSEREVSDGEKTKIGGEKASGRGLVSP
jgi:hypothetical protein